MTDSELQDALSGLHAYDMGCVDSGIKDEALKKRVLEELKKGSDGSVMFTKRISRITREMFLNDEALEEGYGIEDVLEFVDWFKDLCMDINV